MRYLRIPLVILAAVAMTSWATIAMHAAADPQGQSTALERGYRTGYSDGYNAGFRDMSDQASRDHQSKDEFQQADRNYNQVWGPIEDYRDGYQQGFETGYAAGYDRQPFNSSIPTGLTRRSSGDAGTATAANTAGSTTVDNTSSTDGTSGISSVSTVAPVFLPRDSVLLVELQNGLSTDATQQGDPFQARVIEPREFDGAIVEGRVIRVRRPGKVSGTAELQLAFEKIRMPDNRTASLSAHVIEIINTGGPDEDAEVDKEGGVRGKSTTKDDVTKVGASTGIGAIIGAIAGGGKGAAIGAAIGGSIGTAGVLSQRGKDLRLAPGQQLRIRSATDTRIQ